MPEGLLSVVEDGVYVRVHVQPGARRVAMVGVHGDAIKLAVKEAPEHGKANKAVIALLAQALDVPKRDVQVVSGQASRSKRVFVQGDATHLSARVAQLLGEVYS